MVGATTRDSLMVELLWYARLRWIAGAVILGVGFLSLRGLTAWADRWNVFIVLGAVVLGYNLALWFVLRAVRRREDRERLAPVVAATGVLLDLAGLTCLTITTGGLGSPVIVLFVIHMVFASLLMPLRTSYIAAIIAATMVFTGLAMSDQLPATPGESIFGVGWVGALLIVAYMTDHIVRTLRDQESDLLRQQNALIQHEKMTALGQMTAGVVHEIANPLSNMDSVLQLAARRPETLTPAAADSLRVQIKRINHILQQMTNFAHPDRFSSSRVALGSVVGEAIEFVRFDRRFKVVEVERATAGDDVEVSLNPNALEQVLVNLMTNALDATKDVATPRIGVRTRRAGERVLVEITDNGCGIPAGVIERVFDPFFTTKPVGEGTGLGLSISYRLVDRMGGTIRVESREGRGTTFTVELPIADVGSSVRDAPAARVLGSETDAS